MKKTKIVATLGPATYGVENITRLYKEGVNVIRFNFSHADYENVAKQVAIIKDLNEKKKTNLSLLLDTKWPEIRTGDLEEKNEYKVGDIFNIHSNETKVNGKDLYCDYKSLSLDVEEWKIIVIDSGLFDVEVIENHADYVTVRALNDATIGSRRHVNLPGIKLRLPGITEQDKKDILFAVEQKMDFIAPSFIRSAENVEEIRALLVSNDAGHIKIISKIENQEWIDNLEEIIKTSDGVMVARWDLWIEVPIKKLPIYQKQMIELSRQYGKQVIVATHFLETMIDNPFPTRAESSDTFNVVLQKPDTLMLSGETAMWDHPFKAVTMMKSIMQEAEEVCDSNYESYSDEWLSKRDIEKKVMIKNAIRCGEGLGVRAIVLLTKTGKLARLASLYRPKMDIFAFTGSRKAVGFMNILFWVRPRYLDSWESGNYALNLENAISDLLKDKKITPKDTIITVNDIQRDGKEFPVMSIVSVEDII